MIDLFFGADHIRRVRSPTVKARYRGVYFVFGCTNPKQNPRYNNKQAERVHRLPRYQHDETHEPTSKSSVQHPLKP